MNLILEWASSADVALLFFLELMMMMRTTTTTTTSRNKSKKCIAKGIMCTDAHEDQVTFFRATCGGRKPLSKSHSRSPPNTPSRQPPSCRVPFHVILSIGNNHLTHRNPHPSLAISTAFLSACSSSSVHWILRSSHFLTLNSFLYCACIFCNRPTSRGSPVPE